MPNSSQISNINLKTLERALLEKVKIGKVEFYKKRFPTKAAKLMRLSHHCR